MWDESESWAECVGVSQSRRKPLESFAQGNNAIWLAVMGP